MSASTGSCAVAGPPLQKTVDVPRGDALDDTPLDRFSCQLGRRPVRYRQPTFLRWLTGQRDDRRQLLGRKLRWSPAPLIVRQHLHHDLLEIAIGRIRLLRCRQGWASLRPPLPPSAHPLSVDSQLNCLRGVVSVVRRHQDDPAPLGQLLTRRLRPDQRFENPLLPRRHLNCDRPCSHAISFEIASH